VTELPELTVHVRVQADAAADDAETAELRYHVRSMLAEHEFDVTDQPPQAAVPTGAKAGDPAAVSSLVVVLAASGGVLTTLIGALQAWLVRSSARHVVVEIDGDRLELTGVTGEERKRLMAAWLDRHQTAGEGIPDG